MLERVDLPLMLYIDFFLGKFVSNLSNRNLLKQLFKKYLIVINFNL